MIPDKKCYRCSRLHIAVRALRNELAFLVEKRPYDRSALAFARCARLAIDQARSPESRRGFARNVSTTKMILVSVQ